MKHLKQYLDYIKESETMLSNIMTVKAGEVLFHATAENFTAHALSGGNYDDVIWSAKESGIAQTYIPVSGMSSYCSTKHFIHPTQGEDMQASQRQLGIVYDYSKIKFAHGNRVDGGYAIPPAFRKFSEESINARDAWYAAKQEAERLETAFLSSKGLPMEERIKLREDWKNAIMKEEQLGNKMGSLNRERSEMEYVNDKLRALGYTPTSTSDYNGDHSWKLKKKPNGTILPADYRLTGRLLILTAKEDVHFYDYAGDRESDLTDVDYHNLPMFRSAEKKGYDGVRITDFAQVESEGNFGHISFGIFNGSIRKFKIDVVKGVTHPTEEEFNTMFRTRNWHSKEYMEYLRKKGA
jgi:hypothetical protein